MVIWWIGCEADGFAKYGSGNVGGMSIRRDPEGDSEVVDIPVVG